MVDCFKSTKPFIDPLWGPPPGMSEEELAIWHESDRDPDLIWEAALKAGNHQNLLSAAEKTMSSGNHQLARERFLVLTKRRESRSKYAGLMRDVIAVGMNYSGVYCEQIDDDYQTAFDWYLKGDKRGDYSSALNLIRLDLIFSNFSEAEETLKKVLSHRDGWELQILYAELHHLQGNEDKATEHFENFLNLAFPEDEE